MTVSELKRVLAQCRPESEVLIRLESEAFDNPRGLVFEILGHEYSYGCTETLALLLEGGQPDEGGTSDFATSFEVEKSEVEIPGGERP